MLYFFFSLLFVIETAFGQVTLLSQSSFDQGTVRIRSPGTYRLTSNVVFNPSPANDLNNANTDTLAWFPTNSNLYPNDKGLAYSVGYFAALTIESNDVIIDLAGFSIGMHDHFCLQQRFFSVIDCNVPFESGTGPANFGTVNATKNIVIMGPGTIGKSSHHGIHLNSVKNVVIKNLHVMDFEVGGIQLNNFQNAVIENVEIGPSATTVHANVFYSNARFLLQKLKKMSSRNATATIKFADRASPVTALSIYNNLVRSMNLFFKHVFVDGDPNINSLPMTRQNTEVIKAYNLFANKNKLPDGASLYGILLNSYGPAVFAFGDCPGNSSNATITNVNIHDLKHNVKEIIGYYNTANNNRIPVRGPFSDVLDMSLICINDTSSLSTCTYKGTVLSDAQIALSILGKSNLDETGIQTSTPLFKNWAQTNVKLTTGNIRCGADIMTHTIKGIMGIRIDNTNDVELNDVKVSNLINNSPLGSSLCGVYRTEADLSSAYGIYDGYMGTRVEGLIATNSDNIMLNNIDLNTFSSLYGDVIGIDVREDSTIVFNNNNNKINNLNAGSSLSSNQASFLQSNSYPNHYPQMCGLRYDETSSIALIGSSNPNDHVTISNLKGYSPCDNEFEATNVIINQP